MERTFNAPRLKSQICLIGGNGFVCSSLNELNTKLDTLNLTEEQREVIEEAFEAQSAAEAEYATESYFCGIADCIRFLKYIEGTRSK